MKKRVVLLGSTESIRKVYQNQVKDLENSKLVTKTMQNFEIQFCNDRLLSLVNVMSGTLNILNPLRSGFH